MADGKPRSLPEIKKALPHLNGKSICSAVTRLWRERDYLLASELKHTISLQELPGNRFKWSRKKLRWYILNSGENPCTAVVSYPIFKKKLGRNVEIKETLVFKKASEVKDSQKTGATAKVLDALRQSEVAMFPEDFQNNGISVKQAISALHSLYISRKIQRIGWVNPATGEESPFDRGWLYFADSKQAEARIARKDVLSGLKQEIYEFILLRAKAQRRFTRAKAIMKRFDLFGHMKITEIMDEISAVYKDLEKEVINGETFYCIKGILAEDEIQLQREFWKSFGQKRSSFHGILGRAHESFVQIGLDQMWENNDLKISNYRWEFSIDKKGKKRYSKFYQRVRDPSKRWEFDRILHCTLAPFSDKANNEIILVFEMKYRGRLGTDLWEAFLHKLADTWTFGYETKMRDVQGNRVVVRLRKHNVIPVIVVPWKGKDDIEVKMGKESRKVSFAEYVAMQGGMVLFTSEFEHYLEEKLDKKANFMKMFKAWWAGHKSKEEASEEEFTRLLLSFLFERGSNFEEQAVQSCRTQNSAYTAVLRESAVKTA
jgi:hypothetical protein